MTVLKRLFKPNTRAYAWLRGALTRFRAMRMGLRHVHPTAYINASSCIAKDVQIGAYAYVGPDCRIGPRVRIGNYSMLGPGVSIVGGDHRFDMPGTPMIFSGRQPLDATVIEDDAWIGCNAIIIAGNTIGHGSIVAAGSVVTKPVPPYAIVAGVPAVVIAQRFGSDEDRRVHDGMLREAARAGRFCE